MDDKHVVFFEGSSEAIELTPEQLGQITSDGLSWLAMLKMLCGATPPAQMSVVESNGRRTAIKVMPPGTDPKGLTYDSL